MTDHAEGSNEKSDGSGEVTAPASPRFIDARRRGFLQGAVVAGGAAATGTALAHHDADHHDELAVEDALPSSGYRETDHVREYYAKARF